MKIETQKFLWHLQLSQEYIQTTAGGLLLWKE